MKANLFCFFALTFLAPVCANAQVSQPLGGKDSSTAPTTTPILPAQDSVNTSSLPVDITTYRLDTGDTVNVIVDRHGDVSRTVTLLADATVLLPRMEKTIVARGMTCGELSKAIYKSLNNPRTFVLQPGQVNVTLVGQRVRRIFVRGNAVHGGDFDLKNGWRITELVAIMGGVPQADRVHVLLTNAKRPAPIPIDLGDVLKSEQSVSNVTLMEGDTLVFEGPRTKYLFVKGEGPRGRQELDERYTLKQALVALGVSQNNQSGELRKATLTRHTIPNDVNSPTTTEPVDLVDILTKSDVDHDLKDNDTLEIPLSMRFYYVWGELGGQRKRYLPEDRKTYLLDVMSDSYSTTPGQAKIGDVQIFRNNGTDKPDQMHVDYGKFLKSGDPKYNPEIKPMDVVFVPNTKRIDPISTIWTSFGLYNLVKTFVRLP